MGKGLVSIVFCRNIRYFKHIIELGETMLCDKLLYAFGKRENQEVG